MRSMLPIRRPSTGVIRSTGEYICALQLAAGAGDAATAVINDSGDGTGTDMWKLAAVAGGSDRITFDPPIYLPNGIYATLTGSGAVVSVSVPAPTTKFIPDDVPQAEADALIALYHATNGEEWLNTGWLTDTVVGNWYGITVAGGHVTEIDLSGIGLSGDASAVDLSPLSYVSSFYVYENFTLSGISLTGMTALETFRCFDCNFASLDITGLTNLKSVRCERNSIASLDVSDMADSFQQLNAEDNGMTQAAVDAIIEGLWGRRADFGAYAYKRFYVGGTNAAPTGTYQDGYPLPLTPLEMVHDLMNDDGGAGINTWWGAEWNGGSTP